MSEIKPAERPGRQLARDYDFGEFGGRERRLFPIAIEDVRDSRAGDGQFTVRGHAAVFNQWSLDLGGFREKVAPGAFDEVLSRNPDTWLLWDHDPRWVLARTSNKTLELRVDPRGLHYWGRVAPTSYAADLRILMERGDIDQASFAFTVARDEWRIIDEGDDEKVERTILEVGELFDVTVTAMGAYPQTDSQVARALAYAETCGVNLGNLTISGVQNAQELVRRLQRAAGAAPDSPAGAEPEEPHAEGVASEGHVAAQEDPGASGVSPLEDLKRSARERADAQHAEYDRLVKEITS